MSVYRGWELDLRYELVMKNKFVNHRRRFFEVPFEKAKTEIQAQDYFYNYLWKNPDYHPINETTPSINLDNVVKETLTIDSITYKEYETNVDEYVDEWYWELDLRYELVMKNKFVNHRRRFFEVSKEQAKTEDEAKNYFYNYLWKNPDYHPINETTPSINLDNVVKETLTIDSVKYKCRQVSYTDD